MKFPKYWMLASLVLLLLGWSCTHNRSAENARSSALSLNRGWRFTTGDNLTWADPSFNDSLWQKINVSKNWEQQGAASYNGFAWYRTHFFLPSQMKKQALLKDSLQFVLGKIDDYDQVFLNGQFLGQNGKTFSPGTPPPSDFTHRHSAYNLPRIYVVSVNDPRLRWDADNVIAIRVVDSGGLGGLYGKLTRRVAMRDWKEYMELDPHRQPFQMNRRNHFLKTVLVKNRHSSWDFHGELVMTVFDDDANKQVFQKTEPLSLPAGAQQKITFDFSGDWAVPHKATFVLKETSTGEELTKTDWLPYILTPPVPKSPRINGPTVFGARPNHPFLYKIPATGEPPIHYEAHGLPTGLQLDAQTGIISGETADTGRHDVLLVAHNHLGSDSLQFHIVIGDEICLTPPLGWNSWNCWGPSVDDQKVRAAADFMRTTGLIQHGWSYINIDDAWEDGRDAKGRILTNKKFPDMKALARYVHKQGLKLGIYSSPGPLTCERYTGSYRHEFQDAQTYADWGIDYLKYDWCYYREIARDHSLPELKKPYILMRKALDKVNRDIVYSLCQYGMGHVWTWGAEVGGNLWRTTDDIEDTWESMSGIGFSQDTLYKYARPGHWNDPDMLVVGRVGWGPTLRPTRLTPDEQYTHISLWSLLSAPLLIGCDLAQLDAFTLNLLTNDEVLSIDQDELGQQARPVFRKDGLEIWAKSLHNGDFAVGLFNRTLQKHPVVLRWKDLGLSGRFRVRDVWRQKNLGTFDQSFQATVRPHGVVLVRLKKV